MTLGNDAPLLTRRQARELAQSQAAEVETPTDEKPVSKAVPERKKPTDRKPSEKSAAAKATAEKTAVEKATAEKAAAEKVAAEKAQTGADVAGREQAEAERVRADRLAREAADRAQTGATGAPDASASPGVTTDDRTLTRRELRAVIAARLAVADTDTDTASSQEAEQSGDDVDPVDTSPNSTDDDSPSAAVPPPAKAAVPATPAPALPVVEREPLAPVPAPLVRPSAQPAAAAAANVAADPGVESRLPGLHPPLGHWSVDLNDEEAARQPGPIAPFDDLMARGYGAGGIPTTTNALILPSIPNHGAVSGPLTDSGEILVTGSFDLPRSLGSTGQIPSHFDSSELDHMLDKFDDGGTPNAAEPVKASRAVSTHGADLNVLEAPKRHLASVPIVLAVTTAALALGVAALFVGGYLLNIF